MKLLLRIITALELVFGFLILVFDFLVKLNLTQLEAGTTNLNSSTVEMFMSFAPFAILTIIAMLQLFFGYKSMRLLWDKQKDEKNVKKFTIIGVILLIIAIPLFLQSYLFPILNVVSSIQ